MSESAAMLEIRKIRNENSERHLTMSAEEIDKERELALKWFEEAIGKPINVVRSEKCPN